ncbi:MAG: type 1 glutamine amidotransferase [Thermoleophilaceae bacterium]
MTACPTVAFVRHVPWEGPHRIAEALADIPPRSIDVLEGQPLPDVTTLAGAVVMGGPMSVHDTDRFPDLVREKAWIEQALFHELPLLGVCLGSQLIAQVLGAEVAPARRPELGWGAVSILDPDDPVVGPLAPATEVLHWHGEQFGTPPGARLIARSEQTPCQAFRQGAAWGLLFHLEADALLTSRWLAVEAMSEEARRAIGSGYAERLEHGARAAEEDLRRRSDLGLAAFGELVRARAQRLA